MLLEKPWGLIREYTLNQVSTVKMILVKAGASTSFHYHNLRDDMWIILDGGLEVRIGDEVHHPREGDEFVVKAGTSHSISAGDTPGRVLEIDFGFTAEEDVHHPDGASSPDGLE